MDSIAAGAPGIGFDWGPMRFNVDFRTLIMNNMNNRAIHLLLVAKADKSEIARGDSSGLIWKNPALASTAASTSTPAASGAPAAVASTSAAASAGACFDCLNCVV